LAASALGVEFGADIIVIGEAFSEYVNRHGNMLSCRATVLGGLIIDVYIDKSYKGQVTGLLGNADGSPENDIATREGVNLGTSLEFETLYPGYTDSWRISQDESLFGYMTGETTETFTNRDFPYTLSQSGNLPAETRANAEQVCRNAGITNPVVLENCVLDVVLTGENGFAEAAQNLAGVQTTLEVAPPPPAQFGDYGFGKFTGTVLDGLSNQNITGASVNLTMNSNPLPGITPSLTENGYYETSVVAVGSGYKLSIDADGYIPEQVFDLTAQNQQSNEVEPVMLLTSSLSGKIGIINGTARNALDNSVIPNLNVQIRRYIIKLTGNTLHTTQTDQNGHFSFAGLESGNYTLEFYGDGFMTNYATALSIGDATTTKDVVVSPQLGSSQFRIVLSWEELPSDLTVSISTYRSSFNYKCLFFLNITEFLGNLDAGRTNAASVFIFGAESDRVCPPSAYFPPFVLFITSAGVETGGQNRMQTVHQLRFGGRFCPPCISASPRSIIFSLLFRFLKLLLSRKSGVRLDADHGDQRVNFIFNYLRLFPLWICRVGLCDHRPYRISRYFVL